MQYFIFFIYLISFTLLAGVNLRNGNFFTTYLDLRSSQKDILLEIKRTYNSRSPYEGWFGLGYGTEFETYLQPSIDGSVFLHEHGAGAFNRFVKSKQTAEELKQLDLTIAQIVLKVQTQRKVKLNPQQEKKLAEKLKENVFYRQEIAAKYEVQADQWTHQGLLKKTKSGEIFVSEQYAGQTLTVTTDGYQRSEPGMPTFYFSKEGRLTKIKHEGGHTVDIVLNSAGFPLRISDTAGNDFTFVLDAGGKSIKQIKSKDGKVASYTFKNQQMYEMTDYEGNTYRSIYSGQAAKITSLETVVAKTDPLKGTLTVAYDDQGRVAQVTNRDQSIDKYIYQTPDPKNPLKTVTVVQRSQASAPKDVSSEQHEYDYRLRPDGSEWLAYYGFSTGGSFDEIKKKYLNGETQQSFYEPAQNAPIRTVKGHLVTNNKYTKDGLLEEEEVFYKKKSISKKIFSYDPKLRKVIAVNDSGAQLSYRYNNKGQLEEAKSSERTVLFIYEINGRLSRMIEKTAGSKQTKSLSFKFTEDQLTQVTMDKIGVMDIDPVKKKAEFRALASGITTAKIQEEITNTIKDYGAMIEPTGAVIGP